MDTQRLILSRIPCRVDRGRISLVCRAWRDMVRSQQHMLVGRLLPQPRSLQWLLLRAPFPAGSNRVVCVLSGCRVHHYINVVPPDARCFGAHGGAWLFVDTREPVHSAAAVNARTGAFRNLPRELLRRADPYVYRMVIHAAALSSSPDDANCVGAAIVTAWQNAAPGAGPPPRRRCVALWRRDWPRAWDFVPPGQDDVSLNVEDVLYLNHNGAFAFVTQGEHIRICVPLRLSENMLSTKWGTLRFRPGGPLYDHFVRSRYLVVSGGELLMVVRFTPHPNMPTSKFKVFRTAKRNVNDDNADFPIALYPWAWSELDTLGGWMLFVGHGCSRSYKVDKYPGFKEGIYFLDDGKFYDDAVIFDNGNGNHYPCSDDGKWSEGQIQRCFPRSDPSVHSAPVWLLPGGGDMFSGTL
ncbi:hypothetical protein PAHAL_1G045700 [Panicum hallii]|uniref:KIB1-4 beta-propeller domain-containing protein n=2 Tax=Panicum hallii TaxID=206008 RepID=A0A2S3GLK4_9POAL|nr:hypothetical protein PAHAL_1G045700 [Panicum hallii]